MFRKFVITIATVSAVAAAGFTSAQAFPPRETKPPIPRPDGHGNGYRNGYNYNQHGRGNGYNYGYNYSHHNRFFFGSRYAFGPSYYPTYGYDSCYRKIWIKTPYGARRRWVNVCGYY